MSKSTFPIPAPVELTDCVIDMLEDDKAYLVDRDSGERICTAYGFSTATKSWRTKTTFFSKADEDGFWCSYDDRKVVKTLD